MNPVQASLFSKSMGNDLASEFFLIELNLKKSRKNKNKTCLYHFK